METEYNYLFKYILIGESGVGKTSLINRFTDEKYEQNYSCTIGVDFKIKSVKVGENTAKLQIWDTAGQERFRTITRGYYRGANCIIIVFDLSDSASFLKVSSWLNEISEYITEGVEVIILGNKADLIDERKIDTESVQNLLAEFNINKENFYEVSAKENKNVNEVFEKTSMNLIKNNPQLKNIDEVEEEEFEIKTKGTNNWFCSFF